MTKQPTKLEQILDEAISVGYQARMQYGHHSDNMRMRAKKEATQAIYDLIEYVIGEDEDGRDSKVLEGTSCNAACHAIEHRLTKAEQHKRAKELL